MTSTEIADAESPAADLLAAAHLIELLAVQSVPEDAREQHQRTLGLIRSYEGAHRVLTHNLTEERSRREQAEASERLSRKAMAFKDAAILEAHHRVKNTLQIAASALSMQARATSSVEVRGALQEGHRRLELLAKVHELLYRSADSTTAIHMPTLLQAVGNSLRQSFAEMSARVSLRITSDQILFCADDAIPMTLLANEIITNAYKHAFPDSLSGEIALDLKCSPAGALILQITDSGIGMCSNSHENGLGMKLIHSLTAQLGGILTFDRPADARGTTVTLTIHREAHA